MSHGRRRPFVSRWARPVNTIATAIEGACVLPNAEAIVQRNQELFVLLRSGRMREKRDYDRLCKAVLMAENLRMFPLAREHGPTFEAAFDALCQVANARRDRKLDHYVATADQLARIKDALLVHAEQVRAASLSEIEKAERKLYAQQLTVQGRAPA